MFNIWPLISANKVIGGRDYYWPHFMEAEQLRNLSRLLCGRTDSELYKPPLTLGKFQFIPFLRHI